MNGFVQRTGVTTLMTVHHEQHVPPMGFGVNRCHQAPAHGQLFQPSRRNLVTSCGRHHAVVRRRWGVAEPAIAPDEHQPMSPPRV